MKTIRKLLTHAALLGAVGLLATSGWAQSTNAVNTFDASSSTASFVQWWGTASMAWDASLDAGNDAASGSVRYTAPFVGAGGEQFMTHFTIANRWGWDNGYKLNALGYTNFTFAIKVDPASAITSGGNYGNLELGITWSNNWQTTTLMGYNIPLSATNWTKVNLPLNQSLNGLDYVVGYFVKMWSNGAHTNSLIFNLDNFGLQKPEAPIVIPPPTMALGRATPGLALIAASGGQYDRQLIRTVGTNYSWIGATAPVSYSMDVAKHVDASYPGFTAFFHLVPGLANPGRADSDWHETNIVMVRIQKQANGGAFFDLLYKTNSPDSNGNMYGSGSLGGVWNPTGEGTWTVTFTQNTNVTLTTPNGAIFATNLPPEVIPIFSATPEMQVNVGVVPGNASYAGQMVVVKGVKITGTPAPNLNSTFIDTPLDTNIWTTLAAANGVQLIPTTTPFWLNWTLPASGFSLQASDKVAGGTWSNPNLSGFSAGGQMRNLVPQSSLPSASAGFYRMFKPTPVKLQVLFPGETNAPNTLTGKIGTSITQTNGIEFMVTVNMCDSNWNVVSSSEDVVHLNSSDNANAVLPLDTALVNGTVNLPLSLFAPTDPGSFTITATDVTVPTITPGTGTVSVKW